MNIKDCKTYLKTTDLFEQQSFLPVDLKVTIFQNNIEGYYSTSALYKLCSAIWFYFRPIDAFVKCQQFDSGCRVQSPFK